MKIELVMGCLILAAFLAAIAIPMVMVCRKNSRRRVRFNALGAGTHPGGKLSLRADAVIGTKHLLVKRGSDALHAAVIGQASDEPLGVCPDAADAIGDPIDVQLLGGAKGTHLMVAQGTIAIDTEVYSYGDGTVTVPPTATGTYWKVGKARSAGVATQEMEVEPCQPRQVIVLAHGSTLSQQQAVMTGDVTVIVLAS